MKKNLIEKVGENWVAQWKMNTRTQKIIYKQIRTRDHTQIFV